MPGKSTAKSKKVSSFLGNWLCWNFICDLSIAICDLILLFECNGNIRVTVLRMICDLDLKIGRILSFISWFTE
jgi:hypothetical protein